jgi:hypothetical protein
MFLELLLVPATIGQFVCSNSAQIATFDACVRNAMTDPISNQYGFTNPQTACASALTFQTQRDYYRCICERSTSALDCYMFCPGDAIVATNRQLASQYCDAWRMYPENGSANVPLSLPPLPSVPVTSLPVVTTAVVQPSPSQTKPLISGSSRFDMNSILLMIGGLLYW